MAATRWTRADGKRPIQPDGTPASSTSAATWTTYSQVTAFDAAGDGLGFMLGAGFACIDLDHCISPRGTLSRLAKAVVAACPDSFIEVSVSGTGLHIFGQLPAAPRIKLPGVEIYSRARFIRTTGNMYQPGKLTDIALAANIATIMGKEE